jgi:hypothetical protein
LKKKVKINSEEDDVVVIVAPLKNKVELEKIEGNFKGISEFAEKLGGRYEIRMKLDKSLWNYLTEIDLVLPILDQIKYKELYLNLMKVLGYFFYISIFYTIISNNYIILIYFIDSLIEYDLKRNAEIVKCEANVMNGLVGAKRDVNLQLIVFFLSYDDIRAVYIC